MIRKSNYILQLLCILMMWIIASCSDSYNDSDLSDRISGLENRIKSLEEQCKQLNSNVVSIQTLFNAIKSGDVITSVNLIKEGDKEVGYTLAFSKSPAISVYHGKDGNMPVIGAKQDSDGNYYWTVNGEWLLDDKREKAPCNASSNSVTPEFKIDKDNWLMSPDGGKTWVNLGKGTTDGKSGVFNDIDTSDQQKVTFTLTDGTKLTIPRQVGLSIKFDKNQLTGVKTMTSYNVEYDIEGNTSGLKLEVVSSGNVKAKLNNRNSTNGTITITTGEIIDDYDKVMLLASNGKIVVASSISFVEEDYLRVPGDNSYQVSADGGTIEINLETNTDYEVSIPNEAKSWISVVGSRASHQKTLTLSISENNDVARSAYIQLVDNSGNSFTSILISQEDGRPYLKITNGMSFKLSPIGGNIDINLETNTDYEVSIPNEAKSWISMVESRTTRQETVTLTINENSSFARSANVQLVDKSSNAFATISISQEDGRTYFQLVSKKSYEVPATGAILNIYYKSNTDFEVSIPIEAKSWITCPSESYPSSNDFFVNLSISKNEGTPRCATIHFNKNGKTLASIEIQQEDLVTTEINKAFPDWRFRNYVLNNFDVDKDGLISEEEASKVNKIDVRHLQISSLQGINHFKNLKELYCSDNKLRGLGVSECTALTYLDCSDNELGGLDVSKCTALAYLNCSNNNMSKLDISKNASLTYLDCSVNKMTELDVSQHKSLIEVNCSYNNLSSLYGSGCTSLTYLNCSQNSLKTLDVSECKSLNELNCSQNSLNSLDVSGCIALTKLDYSNNNLNTLNVSGCTSLTELNYVNMVRTLNASGCISMKSLNWNGKFLNEGQLTTLDISGCTALSQLNCCYTSLTSLDVSGCTSLTEFDCSNNRLTILDASGCKALTQLSCSSNKLTSLDVSGCTKLTHLICEINKLTSLAVSGCTALYHLECCFNELSSLDVSGCTKLSILDCRSNKLHSLDILKNTSLRALGCSGNQLASLDVSKNTALTELMCAGNQLTSLNVSKNTALTELMCGSNQLTSLDISQNTALTDLSCDHCELTSLNVSKNTALRTLHCSNNKLASLDVSQNKALTSLVCSDNLLTTLYVLHNLNLQTLECDGNLLNSLDLSIHSKLWKLDCTMSTLKILYLKNHLGEYLWTSPETKIIYFD